MDFSIGEDREAIRAGVQAICAGFDADYWLRKDREGGFPHDFYAAFARAGWLGICIPQDCGGSGLGVVDACVMFEAVSGSGAGLSGASALHINIFGLSPVIRFGSEEQKRRMLPPIAAGEVKACFGVTEPDTGLNTTEITLRAVRTGDRYVVDGQKVWISTARVADKILLLARTTPIDRVARPADGLSLFYTDFDRHRISVREIEKMGRKAVDSNELFFEGFEIPVEDRIGEEGQGFRYLLHGLNPERCLLASEAIGLGRAALARAAEYARERIVFGRPIGKNQAIQHPLARNWMELEAAWLMTLQAASRYDRGLECGPAANAAKYLAAEAGFRAAEQAVLTHGGFGYAKDYHVERYFREMMIPRIAPVSREMILSFIAEKVLGQPKSY